VERVTYHTEETGYCILRVIPEGKFEPVSLIGKAPRVVAGEQFEAIGKWESTRDYGQQFKADTLKLKRPDSVAERGAGPVRETLPHRFPHPGWQSPMF
jgi:exodeoxyribonuclease V alpha subunit